MSVRGIKPIVRAADLTPAELAAIPSDQPGDSFLTLAQTVRLIQAGLLTWTRENASRPS